MASFVAICTFNDGTDMSEVFVVVHQERARVAELSEQGRVGAIHLCMERGTIFIETFANDLVAAEATIRTLPMSAWWDIDLFPVVPPPVDTRPSASQGFTESGPTTTGLRE